MEKFLEKLLSLFSVLPDFWNFQIAVVDKSPITIGTIILGIILFISGYFLCLYISRSLEKRLFAHFDIEPSILHNLKNITFYILLVFLILFVLRFLNMPLTAFTFLGGALAVGAGLGSQNIVNNFISGLIIMMEQPIKVGDIIDVDGLHGTVEQIGARGTKVKAADNTHIIVPNSSFLEKNLLNWTLYDNVVRGQVKVGVAYGSDSRKAEKLIKQATDAEERVLKYPEPKVIFEEFGDSALAFSVYFWARAPNLMIMLEIKSNVRFQIDEIFRKELITIAFPQRDIHIDTLNPLKIEVLNKLDKAELAKTEKN